MSAIKFGNNINTKHYQYKFRKVFYLLKISLKNKSSTSGTQLENLPTMYNSHIIWFPLNYCRVENHWRRYLIPVKFRDLLSTWWFFGVIITPYCEVWSTIEWLIGASEAVIAIIRMISHMRVCTSRWLNGMRYLHLSVS